MPPLAMLFGGLLTVLGVVLYVITDMKSMTALIPSLLGVLLIVLGLVARRGDQARKHAMHVAALVGMIGLAGGIAMALRVDRSERPETFWGSVLMGVLSAVFLVLCVKSFIAARRARQASQPPV